MSSITFVDYQTIIPASWLNDVNNMVYNGVVPATTLSPTNLSVSTNASIANITNNVVFTSTGAITLPNGTTAQEPGTPSAGMIRFNSTKTQFEGYNGSAWSSFGIVGGSNAQVQYNSSGALAGSANFTFNGTTVTMANDASIHGLTVGQGAGSVSTNTAVGVNALSTNTTGATVTAIGYQAAKNSSTGGDITAIGNNALATYTGGGDVTAVGSQSLVNTTSGVELAALGYSSLRLNTTGSYNTAVGSQALYSNTTASYNTALGYQSLYSNTVAGYSVALGYQAGYSYNRTADNNNGYNTFVGPFAGYYCTTGRANTVIGGFNGNQGGLDIRTSSNYIVLADGDGNPQGYYTNTSLYWSFVNQVRTPVLYATGTGNAGGVYLGAGTSNGLISQASAGSGTITTYIGNQAITTISDSRLKENVVDTTRNGLQLVNQLRVVDHTWNDPSDQCENNRNSRGVWMGLIAQEAQPIIPWLVNKPTKDIDEEGNPQYWHMDYGYSVPLLIKAIQELSAQVTALQAKVGA